MVAAFNPCGFAMLPDLTLVVQGEGPQGDQFRAPCAVHWEPPRRHGIRIPRIKLVCSVCWTVSLASTVQRYLPYVTPLPAYPRSHWVSRLLSGRELVIRSAAGERGGRPRPGGFDVRLRHRLWGDRLAVLHVGPVATFASSLRTVVRRSTAWCTSPTQPARPRGRCAAVAVAVRFGADPD